MEKFQEEADLNNQSEDEHKNALQRHLLCKSISSGPCIIKLEAILWPKPVM
jgi:hypothetical protein